MNSADAKQAERRRGGRDPADGETAAPASADRQAALARIRLRHLQCFLAVAQFGTLRRAAEALSITQPAVTKTLNELEALLGRPLFQRGRQGARLTADAQRFLRHAAQSVHALGEAVDSVLRPRQTEALRLGVLPTVAAGFLPDVLGTFARAWPEVDVQVTTARNADLLLQLRRRELDAVVGRLADAEPMAGLSFEPLFAEPMVIVIAPGHPLGAAPVARADTPAKRRAASASLAGVAAHPCILPPAGTLLRQVADAFLASHGLAPVRGSVETLDTSLARALVRRGEHLWFTPLGAVQPDLEGGLLRRLPVTLAPEEPVGLVLRAEPQNSPALAGFVDLARGHAAARRAP